MESVCRIEGGEEGVSRLGAGCVSVGWRGWFSVNEQELIERCSAGCGCQGGVSCRMRMGKVHSAAVCAQQEVKEGRFVVGWSGKVCSPPCSESGKGGGVDCGPNWPNVSVSCRGRG